MKITTIRIADAMMIRNRSAGTSRYMVPFAPLWKIPLKKYLIPSTKLLFSE